MRLHFPTEFTAPEHGPGAALVYEPFAKIGVKDWPNGKILLAVIWFAPMTTTLLFYFCGDLGHATADPDH